MSKSGNRINYSLRLQKNVERKIFGDIIRSLNYFMPVNQYRYIGFGSFYFQDFLLFFDEFAIKEEISIEQDNTSYVKGEDVIKELFGTFKETFEEKEKETKLIKNICSDYYSKMSNAKELELTFITELSRRIKDMYYSKVDRIELFSRYHIGESEKYNYSPKFVKQKLEMLMMQYLNYFITKEMQENRIECEEEKKEHVSVTDFLRNYDLNNMICIDEKEIIKRTDRMVVNRYNFNKPYGFIEMNFNYDITAIEKLEWESDKKNIIWLDYDEFLSPTMLESLEKCIKLTSSGSLIILSVSMGQKPEDRLERFKANFNIGEEFSDYDDFLEEDEFTTGDWHAKGIEETYRITDDIGLKDCDSSTIHSTLYKIIDKTVQIALNKKNRHRENSEPEYKIQQIFNCVYSDGVPMFTYGIIVYSSLDKEDDENFPTNVLSEYPWLKTNQEKYEIEIPILTHKEVNAINQLLPDNDAKAIKELLPFIPLSDIKKYVNIYRYYPHFFEVGDYV